MRKFACVAIGTILLLGPLFSSAEEVQVEVNVPQPQLRQDERGFTHVELEGCMAEGEPGAPWLPACTVNVLLPPGHVVESVRAVVAEAVVLPGEHLVFPAQGHRPLSWGAAPFVSPDAVVYRSARAIPQEVLRASGRQLLRGFGVQPVLIRPVAYRPSAGALSYFPSVLVVVSTVPGKPVLENRAASYRGLVRDFGRVGPLAVNPEMLARYQRRADKNLATEYRYVIVTNQALADCPGPNNFKALADEKESRGITTLTKTMESILTTYSGLDDAEKVRAFIKDMYTNNGTDFVLLAGDADLDVVGGETEPPIVPIRGLVGKVDYMADDNIPSDLYYGCLDGDFNADGDEAWGEENDGVDMFAEVWVGRAPVDSCAEVSNFVRKTLAYRNAAGDWLRKVTMVGEFIQAGYYATEELEQIHFSSSADGYSTKGFSESSFFQVSTLYDTESPAFIWDATDILEVINGGVHIINHLGHSFPDYNLRLYTDDIGSEMTNDLFFFEYTQGCHAGCFDNRLETGEVSSQDAVGEHLLLEAHGAAALVANTRYGFGTGCSNAFHRYFWDGAFRQGMTQMGEMHAYSREKLSGLFDDPFFRWVTYEITLFGDPELSFHVKGSEGPPAIGLPAESPSFLALAGGENPPAQTISVQNLGGGVLNWSVQSDRTWLKASPASGTAPTDLVLSVDATGLGTGEYSAALTFSASDATNSPQVLGVDLRVVTVPAVVAPFAKTAPTVDGTVRADEYTGAVVLDLNPDNPGTSTARLIHDGAKLYFALEIGADSDVDTYDYMSIFLDTNGDDVWPSTLGDEGVYEIYSDNLASFLPLLNRGAGLEYGEWDDNPVGVVSAFGARASPRVMEAAFDLTRSHMKVPVGESFGMFLFFNDFLSGENFDLVAAWPWAVSTFDTCHFFGGVTLGTNTTPRFVLGPATLAFEAVQGGALPPGQTFQIENGGAGALDWTASLVGDWFALSPSSGSAPASVTVTPISSSLEFGSHAGAVVLTAPGANSARVELNYRITGSGALLTVDPQEIAGSRALGEGPLEVNLRVGGAQARALEWSISEASPWLSVNPTSGQAPAGGASLVTVRLDPAGLAVGTHDASLTVTAPNVDNSPVTVPVSFTVYSNADNRPPPIPILLSPPDQSVIDNATPDLTVESARDPDGDAVTYTFEVYEMDSSMPWVYIKDVPDGKDGITQAVVDRPLKNGGTYQWRARAVDQRNAIGEWSEKWTFTVNVPEDQGGCGCGTSAGGGSGGLLLLFWVVALALIRIRD